VLNHPLIILLIKDITEDPHSISQACGHLNCFIKLLINFQRKRKYICKLRFSHIENFLFTFSLSTFYHGTQKRWNWRVKETSWLHSPGTIAINSRVYSWHPLLMEFHMNVYFSCFIQTSGAVVRVCLCIISLRKCKQGQNLLIIQQWKAERISLSTDNTWLYVKDKHFHIGYNYSKTLWWREVVRNIKG